MKILFMGTPDFALEILRSIYDAGENILGVVCQPDKPKGRGHKMMPPPTKAWAEEKGIPVFQPQTMKDEAFLPTLKELDPDMIVVAAYGKILPHYIISYPRYGCINAHGSLLPKYRGAAPMQRALMDGERETGVTAMYMDDGLDTGDMIYTEIVEITDEDNFETLHDKMAAAGAHVILKTVETVNRGETLPREKQSDEGATYAAKITKEDRIIDFSLGQDAVFNKIRGLSPFPKAFTVMPDGSMLQITASRRTDIDVKGAAFGTVLSADNDGFTVACSDGAVQILEVVPAGKGKMSAADFVRGRKIAVGDVLGASDDA